MLHQHRSPRCLPVLRRRLSRADSVVFASDYPHPDAGFPGLLEALWAAPTPAAAIKDAILGANAERLYGLG